MGAPPLAVFQASLDGGLSNLVQWEVSLSMAQGLELDDLKGPFLPQPFYDSVTCHISVLSLVSHFHRPVRSALNFSGKLLHQGARAQPTLLCCREVEVINRARELKALQLSQTS